MPRLLPGLRILRAALSAGALVLAASTVERAGGAEADQAVPRPGGGRPSSALRRTEAPGDVRPNNNNGAGLFDDSPHRDHRSGGHWAISDAADYGLGEDDPRVVRWRRAWRDAFERAWSEAHVTPAPHLHTGASEARRRILQVPSTSSSASFEETYSGYNFPGSVNREDRPYVLPFAWSPPPPEPPPGPASPPPLPNPPTPPPPYPVLRGRAWRDKGSPSVVDLFVEYVGFGPIFESVDRFYYAADADALEGPDAFAEGPNKNKPPRSDRRHVQMFNVSADAAAVYARLADVNDVPVSDVAVVAIESGNHLLASVGGGDSKDVRVRTLWELVAAMRDEGVQSVTLEGHIGLGGTPLPPIAGGRDLTIIGACSNVAGPVGVTSPPPPPPTPPSPPAQTGAGGRRRGLLQDDPETALGEEWHRRGAPGANRRDRGQRRDRRSLLQLQFTSAGTYDVAYSNAFAGSFRDLTGEQAFAFLAAALAAMQTVAASGTAVQLISDQARKPATPYGDGFPWDDDAWVQGVSTMFTKGHRFDTPLAPDDFPSGTVYAHGGPAEAIPVGGPGMNVTGGTIPLDDRCVINGLQTDRLFTVGDPHVVDCRWPAATRPRGVAHGSGAAVPRLVNIPGHPGLISATGGYSPWGAVKAPPWTRGPAGRRCGRLVLERLVLRRAWSETQAGAAVGVYGGELELRSCVVEGARTGLGAGRGGAVVNRGGSVSVRGSVFRDNSAGRGKDGADVGDGPGLAEPGDNMYHYAGSLYVDQVSMFNGVHKPVTRANSEVAF